MTAANWHKRLPWMRTGRGKSFNKGSILLLFGTQRLDGSGSLLLLLLSLLLGYWLIGP